MDKTDPKKDTGMDKTRRATARVRDVPATTRDGTVKTRAATVKTRGIMVKARGVMDNTETVRGGSDKIKIMKGIEVKVIILTKGGVGVGGGDNTQV